MKKAIYKGFTLVELLVVIGVIAVILGISIFGIGGARKGSRDTKRKADLETIRSAAELYRSDYDGYPATLAEMVNYLGATPTDPISSQSYDYQPSGCVVTCTSYKVWAAMENPSTADASCGVVGSCGSGPCNFCVTNP